MDRLEYMNNLTDEQAKELILIRVKSFAKRASNDETCRLMLYGIHCDLCLQYNQDNLLLLCQIEDIVYEYNHKLSYELADIREGLGIFDNDDDTD